MKKILTILIGIAFSALMSTSLSAQNGYEVKGNVVDNLGPIIGATVMEAGTSNGVMTDSDGRYSLIVSSAEAIVEISCIGYATLSFKADALPQSVVLKEDAIYLEEAVAIGYGSLSKKELSSSIVQVSKEKFFKGSMNNPMEMLSGKVAGLTVNTTSAADPNSSSSLQIRGATSLSASNSPLIVIDGVPGGDIRNLAAQDIESMTVLKDAASAAIYGTRGANGVILVTTRRGVDGAVGAESSSISYDSWVGVNLAKPRPDIMSPDEFRRSLRGTDYGSSTDWYDLITRDFSYDLNQYIAFDKVTKNGSYNASINYKDATGMDIKTARKEFGGRIAMEQRGLNNRLKVNFSLSARRVNEEWGNNMFDTALNMNPTMPVYNEDGTFYQPTSPTDARNPVSELVLNENNGQRMYLLGSAEARYTIITNDHHNLSTSVLYSLHYNDLKSNYYTPSTSGECFWKGYTGRANVAYEKWYTNHLEWLLNYQFNSGKHDVKFVGGYSYEDNNWEKLEAGNSNFAFDNMSYNSIGSGTYLKDGKASMYTGKSLSKLIGVFGRVNYNWNDILMASASVRYEGSTKFGADHKWGAFPAGSIAWEIAKMPFMQGSEDIISSLKPRISYGVTGRSDFDAYKSLSTYGSSGAYLMDGDWVTGYKPTINANPNLGWEKLVSTNIGIDFALFGERLRGSVDLFERQSKDLLYNYTAPQPPFIHSSILVNVGTTSNKGVELSLEGDIIKTRAFSWTSGINYSIGSTFVKKLSDDIYHASYVEAYQKPGVGTSEYFFRYQEGSKIGQFYGYEYAGATETGEMQVYNEAGEVILAANANANDKKYLGNGAPANFFSWSNTLRYKNFDLNIFFSGAAGFEIFNMRKYGMGLQGCGTDNVLRSAYREDKFLRTGGGVISSFFLEKGDYFKLENLTLGYNFSPKNKEFILNHLRVYVAAKNLFTITKYSGTDPAAVSLTGLTPGVDNASAYPLATQLTLGLTLRF